MILSFLYKCVEVFTVYFKDLEEESVRDNFVVIYELLVSPSGATSVELKSFAWRFLKTRVDFVLAARVPILLLFCTSDSLNRAIR